MNAVEIEQAVTDLAEAPFDRDEFPFAFLEAFGNKTTTIKKLRKGASNKSDVGGVLQTGNVHILTAEPGGTPAALEALRTSPATDTKRLKVRFLVATDGEIFEAEDRTTGESVVCAYRDFPNHFGLFLPLAGISTVKAIRENAFDVRATSRLNRLYVQLLQDNPDWSEAERRPDLNHFFARLIFCFFAEDTDILNGEDLFTATVQQMGDDTNTHQVIAEIFRAMNVAIPDRATAGLPRWADAFPYVNGGLFGGSAEVPTFSKIARRYLLHIGNLDWKRINPDIFGSMIQAVADDEERGALGMHYTSVPNILKVLNPLFLDDLRAQLETAGDNARKLLNLRKRMARIRVFDPACGSGNFLVIAYKEMRAIEAEVNERRHETGATSVIPLTNFRGIEIRDFSAEIARLALIIAEYQCDVLHRGQMEALAKFLPLDAENWITCGNALQLDWLMVCPPTELEVRLVPEDLFQAPLQQAEVEFENEGGETYICGNPPYAGSSLQTAEQKDDLRSIFEKRTSKWKNFDLIAAWFYKAGYFSRKEHSSFAFVTTNSISQGQQAAMLWPLLFEMNLHIFFANRSFKWSNLAKGNAGVTVSIVGVTTDDTRQCRIYLPDVGRMNSYQAVERISAYLTSSGNEIVPPRARPISPIPIMLKGNQPTDGGHLVMTKHEADELVRQDSRSKEFVFLYTGSREAIRGQDRYCLWIEDSQVDKAKQIVPVATRLQAVADERSRSRAPTTRPYAATPHRFRQIQSIGKRISLVIPSHSSERREHLPVAIYGDRTIVSNSAFALYDTPLWNLALIASRIHLAWIATVCGKIKTDFRYSNTLGWNTFPVPPLTLNNKDDLTAHAESILLTREAHFPATIADLYDPEKMPDDLRAAHDANDETLERIYIGRRFKNDTERLEHLFALYTKMTSKEVA